MTKKCLISFIAYTLFSAVCFLSMHLMLLADVSKYVGVVFGLLLLVVGLVVFLCVWEYFKEQKKREYGLLAFLPMNAIGSGLAISSLYVHWGASPTVLQSLCIWGAYILLFLFYCLLANIPFFKRHPYICIVTFGVLLLVGACIGLGLSSKIVGSLVLMIAILFIAFLATILVHSQDFGEHSRYLAMVSFAGLAVVIVAVLFIISQGEFLEAVGDGGSLDNAYRYPKYNPYAFYDSALALESYRAMLAASKRGAEAIERLRADDIEVTLGGGMSLVGKPWFALLVTWFVLFSVIFVLCGITMVDALVLSADEYTKGEIVGIIVIGVVDVGLIALLAFVTQKWRARKKTVATWLEDAVFLTASTSAYAERNQEIALEAEFVYNDVTYVKRSTKKGAPRYLYAYRQYVGNRTPIAYSPQYDEVMLIRPRSLNDPRIYEKPEGGEKDAKVHLDSGGGDV